MVAVLFAVAAVSVEGQSDQVHRCFRRKAGKSVQITSSRGGEIGPTVSPDGQMLAFEYFHPDRPNLPQIWVMDRAQGFKSARPLVDNDDFNSWPSWSPDSKWISFVSKRKTDSPVLTSQVYKARVSDGTIVQLTDFPKETDLGDSTSWSRDGRVTFGYDDAIYAVAETGGTPTKLLDLKTSLAPDSLWGIEWSPDGSFLAFRGSPLGSSEKQFHIWVADSQGRHVRSITAGHVDDNPSWLDNSHILFERWVSGTDIRVCVLCLKTLAVHCLTRGHPDVAPNADPTGRVIYFARGTVPKEEDRSGRFFYQTHLYCLLLKRDGRVLKPD